MEGNDFSGIEEAQLLIRKKSRSTMSLTDFKVKDSFVGFRKSLGGSVADSTS